MPHETTPPLLSLCMIVKNEAEHLETCLKLARPHVDEIVIVDTGSTDGTQEIARRYADVFEEIEWPNSFAIARNHSLKLASGRYILILDGDEYIADARAWRSLREMLEAQPVAGIRLRVRNVLPPGGLVEADVSYQERVFPNTPEIRYEGRIHNQILHTILAYQKRTGHPILDVPFEVIHVGYAFSQQKLKEKYQPRLPLLVQAYEEAENPVQKAYYGYQLAAGYYVLREYEQALELFKVLNYDAMAKGNVSNAFYAQMLGAQAALLLKRGEDALRFCEGMLRITRQEPMAYFLTGAAFLLTGQIENGMLFISESFEINDKYKECRFPINKRAALGLLQHVLKTIGLKTLAQEVEDIIQRNGSQEAALQNFLQRLKMLMVLAEQKKEMQT